MILYKQRIFYLLDLWWQGEDFSSHCNHQLYFVILGEGEKYLDVCYHLQYILLNKQNLFCFNQRLCCNQTYTNYCLIQSISLNFNDFNLIFL